VIDRKHSKRGEEEAASSHPKAVKRRKYDDTLQAEREWEDPKRFFEEMKKREF